MSGGAWSESLRVALDEAAVLVAGVLGGDRRGGLPARAAVRAGGLTGAYQAVFITIPATAMNACPEFAYTVIHAPGPGWP